MSGRLYRCKQCTLMRLVTPDGLCADCIIRILRCRVKKIAQNALDEGQQGNFYRALKEIITFIDNSVVKEE